MALTVPLFNLIKAALQRARTYSEKLLSDFKVRKNQKDLMGLGRRAWWDSDKTREFLGFCVAMK